jgi:hypothetical protein
MIQKKSDFFFTIKMSDELVSEVSQLIEQQPPAYQLSDQDLFIQHLNRQRKHRSMELFQDNDFAHCMVYKLLERDYKNRVFYNKEWDKCYMVSKYHYQYQYAQGIKEIEFRYLYIDIVNTILDAISNILEYHPNGNMYTKNSNNYNKFEDLIKIKKLIADPAIAKSWMIDVIEGRQFELPS